MKTFPYIFMTMLLLTSGINLFAQSGMTIKPGGSVTVNGNTIITQTFAIGQAYGGGIIFYIDGTGQHGLIAATTDQSSGAQWGCYGTRVSGTSNAIGTGQANTTAIVNGCSTEGIAARICNNLVLNGYSDWFLPSKDELYQMYLHKNVIGGLYERPYWSSTESNSNLAWYYVFSGYPSANTKIQTCYVRAVRAF